MAFMINFPRKTNQQHELQKKKSTCLVPSSVLLWSYWGATFFLVEIFIELVIKQFNVLDKAIQIRWVFLNTYCSTSPLGLLQNLPLPPTWFRPKCFMSTSWIRLCISSKQLYATTHCRALPALLKGLILHNASLCNVKNDKPVNKPEEPYSFLMMVRL